MEFLSLPDDNDKESTSRGLASLNHIPQAQKQEAIAIDLSKDGNILLYGSPGTGKTTFLQTAAMDLARKQSPENLTMYLLDFGTNGLAPLTQLPHVADSLLLDQTEKIQKFIRIINRELDRRKKLLSEHGVGTIALYREVTGKQEPTMVILMDSYESMKDEPYETDLFKLFMRISREGLSIGVHLIITASRQNNLRAQLYSNFKHQLTLPQNDISEVRGIVGATPLASTMEDIKGRALMKRDEVDVVQFALPVAGDNDIQIINNLRDQVQSLKEMWTGHTPAGIPMVPDELTEATFYGREDVAALLDEGKVPLGLDLENVQPLSWDLIKGNLLYIFEQEWQKLNIINTMILSFEKLNFDSILLTTSKSQKQSRFSKEIDSPLGRKNTIEELYDLVSENVDLDEILPKPMVIIWDEIGELIQENEILSDKILYIMTNGPKVKVYSFIITLPMLSNSLNVVSKFIKQLKYAVVEMRLNDQKIISVSNVKYSEPVLGKSVAYMVDGNHYQTMKLLKGVE